MEDWLSNVVIDLYGETLSPVQTQVAHVLGVLDSLKNEMYSVATLLKSYDTISPEYLYLQNLTCSVSESPLLAAVETSDTFPQALDRLLRVWEANLHALSHMSLDSATTIAIGRVQMWVIEMRLVQSKLTVVIDSYAPVLNMISNDKRLILKQVSDFSSTTCAAVMASERALLTEADTILSSIPVACSAFDLFRRCFRELLEPWRSAWLCAELKISAENPTERASLTLVNSLLLKPSDFPLTFEVSREELEIALHLLTRVAPSSAAVDVPALLQCVFEIRGKFAEEVQLEQQGFALNSLRRLRREVHKYLQCFARGWVAARAFEQGLKTQISDLYGCDVPAEVVGISLIAPR